MAKILVTGGCSFSDQEGASYGTWPNQLKTILPQWQHIITGMGAQGNGLISRRVIYEVTKLLKFTAPKDILVGIMWSGPSRYDFYLKDINFPSNIDMWVENPSNFVDHSEKNWVIIGQSWRNVFAKSYYATFYSHIGSLIYTYEHILRVQWFLKSHNIKYFMSSYTDEVFPQDNINHVDVAHLHEQIDFDQFLPVVGEYEWCRDYSGIPYINLHDKHPTFEQHQLFTEQVIIPFLQDKKYL